MSIASQHPNARRWLVWVKYSTSWIKRLVALSQISKTRGHVITMNNGAQYLRADPDV